MARPWVAGVHLVGSVPLPTTEDTFRTICKGLPKRLKRIPDGEPGIRNYFARWQIDLLKHEPLVMNEAMTQFASDSYSDDQAEQASASVRDIETHYDDYALESYGTFKRLRDEGVIPKGIRFLYGIVRPVTCSLLAGSDAWRRLVRCANRWVWEFKR